MNTGEKYTKKDIILQFIIPAIVGIGTSIMLFMAMIREGQPLHYIFKCIGGGIGMYIGIKIFILTYSKFKQSIFLRNQTNIIFYGATVITYFMFCFFITGLPFLILESIVNKDNLIMDLLLLIYYGVLLFFVTKRDMKKL